MYVCVCVFVCIAEALELISTAANHSNAAIRKMVRRAMVLGVSPLFGNLSDLSKRRSALPNQTVADALSSALLQASVTEQTLRVGTDRKLPFPAFKFHSLNL